MFKFFILMIIFFVLILFAVMFSIIRMVKNALFGPSDKQTNNDNSRMRSEYRSESNNQSRSSNEYSSQNRKKIFSKDDGEYVDYEDVT